MKLLIQHTQEDEKREKHIPVFINEKEIQVGSELHPMLEEHHIEFIQAISQDKKQLLTKFLDINSEPKMIINENHQYLTAIEYCNIHGLWQGKNY